jgi:carbon-monoxide dehydrogenase medium subunit
VERAFPLARAAWEVGAPQIRNRGTIAGNLITASPANDTIPPLIALDAQLTLASSQSTRAVPLSDFYTGVRQTVMRPDEMIVDIAFPAMKDNQIGAFYKLGLRRAQAISVVNGAVLLTFAGDSGAMNERYIETAVIALGSVAPTIVRAQNAEVYLQERQLSETTINHTANLARDAASPIGDVRSSADYRSEMVRVSVLRCLRAIWQDDTEMGFPERPVLLWGRPRNGDAAGLEESVLHQNGTPIITRINGQPYQFDVGQGKTLLHLLREDAGLIGTKEGCAEGECGACTVFLDGVAVMSCLVPAARAHLADIVTVEGLEVDGHMHPVQETFVSEGAVQCGYCTPGFIMSAVKLLEEQPTPTREEIKQAITGNLCRCTGYYKIIEAIEKASLVEVAHE